jgi:hypothetical protein
LNIEIGIALFLLFSFPSFFIFKGTGNALYLCSGLVGLAIYFFNIKYVRDKDKTFRSLVNLKNYLDDYKKLSNDQMGILDFLYIHLDDLVCLSEIDGFKEIRKLIFFNQNRVDQISAKKQLEEFEKVVDRQEVFSLIEKQRNEYQKKFEIFERFNKDLVNDLSKKGFYVRSVFD